MRPYNGNISVVGVCPETPEPTRRGGWGGINHTWGPDNSSPDSFLYQVQGSYAMNGWCYGPDLDPGPYKGTPGGTRYPPVGPREAWHAFPTPQSSIVPIFCDSSWVDAWPVDTDPPGDLVTGDQQMMTRVCLKRHNKRFCNVSFLDGHAESVLLPDLWKLKWSKVFDTGKTPPRMPANFGK